MPATCVPQYVPRANTGLSKHGDPVFPHFWSWNQNLARVCARGGVLIWLPLGPNVFWSCQRSPRMTCPV